jgi:glycosyltransferase involved in cell wall biosynthesis
MIAELTTKKDIICLATRRIDDDLPTNVQHLMLRLAENHRILYVEPPVDNVFIARNPNFLNRRQYLKTICPENLKPIWPVIFPYEKWVPLLLPFLNQYKMIASIRRAMQKFKIKPEIVWLFRPQDFWIEEHLNPSYLCYHITDKYNTMPVNAKNRIDAIKMNKLEKRIFKRADLVFCTARSLWKEVSLQHEKTVYVGNVADVNHFAKANNPATQIPEDIVDLPHPIVGFFGAISSFKINYNLIKVTAETFSKGSVVLIGPILNFGKPRLTKIPEEKNIHYLGTRDYSSLPCYLKGFDICIIPYIDSEYTKHVFPLKFFEYLSAGKPIVSTPLPSLKDFNHLFYQANNEAEWTEALMLAISENSEKKKCDRRNSTLANSWSARVSQIECHLCEL